jgi:ABC-type sulfate transport system permease subunit
MLEYKVRGKQNKISLVKNSLLFLTFTSLMVVVVVLYRIYSDGLNVLKSDIFKQDVFVMLIGTVFVNITYNTYVIFGEIFDRIFKKKK